MDWQYELLAVFLLLPLLWWQTRNNNTNIKELINDNKQCSVNVINVYKEEMGKFYELLSHHIKEDNENFKWIKTEISKAIGKTRLTKDQILEVAKSRVWLTSEKKLDFIRKRLEKNNLYNRRDIVIKQVTTEMNRRSEEYIDFLNQFTTNVWLLWDWIAEHFPMEDFLQEVFDIIFKENVDILQKVEDIRWLMMWYQNELWEKLKKDLININ